MSKKKIDNKEIDGLLPPQAVDIECAVLGAILIDPSSYNAVSDMLFPELFYEAKNGIVCEAILRIKNNGSRVDLLTTVQELKRMGEIENIGGAYYVSTLTNRIASAANIESHTRILMEKYLKRECIMLSTQLIKKAYEPESDPFDVFEQSEKNMTAMTSRLFVTKSETSHTLLKKFLEENAAIVNNKGSMIGVPSGFHALDVVTHGWNKSDLIILAARPGMGKTAFVVGTAAHAVKQKIPVGVFSLEMSSLQLFKRIASQESDIPLEMISYKGLQESDLKLLLRDIEPLMQGNLFIDDTGGISLYDLKNRARKWKRENKIELLVVDYLQLIDAGIKGNREQEVSSISRALKALAKELDIPIIALSQLSRQVENRPGGDKKPKLSDLRDSGAIEQDADLVLFIHRAEYYGIEYFGDNTSTKGHAEIIIAKNRHGALETVGLQWIAECTKFVDFRKTENPFTHIQPVNYHEPLKQNDDFLN